MLQYCGIDLTAGVCNFVESWIIKTYQNTETSHILSPCIAYLNNTFSYCHHCMQNHFFLSCFCSGRPHALGLLQRFMWRRHQPGVSPPLSVRVQRGYNGEFNRTIHTDCNRDHHE